jgi:hypothetical protein
MRTVSLFGQSAVFVQPFRPPCDFWRSMSQVIDSDGTPFCHGLKTKGGSKRLRNIHIKVLFDFCEVYAKKF